MKNLVRQLGEPDPQDLVFVPLGGVGEIGMNLSLYGYGGRWLMVDCGVTFADDSMPGLDVIMADPTFIEERRGQLAGLVATHAHEDHIGAIPHLWRRFGGPIYATPFTAEMIRRKLVEVGLAETAKIIEVPLSGRFSVGPFDLEFITVTHSIPEPNALVIRTPAGTVLHTGDWKLDPDPMIGPTADEDALRRLGDEGVLAMICDSTNATRPGDSGSEGEVRRSLVDLIAQCPQRVAVACFASNLARVASIAEAGIAADRQTALIGRSLRRIDEVARGTGYLAELPTFATEDEAGYLPRDKALLICTGSQGEPRAALARIAANDHPHVTLEEGDTVIFSSRVIPGNEKSIGRLQNQLARLGVQVVTEQDHFVHVSGHPAQDELRRMYELVRPKIALPVHGEMRHLLAHAALAEECGAEQSLVISDGEMVRLSSGRAEVIDEVPVGRLALDGYRLLPLGGETLKNRSRMIFNGSAVATVVLDGNGQRLAPPQVTVRGLAEDDETSMEVLMEGIDRAISGLSAADKRKDEAVADAVKAAIRRALRARHGKRPVTDVHVVRI